MRTLLSALAVAGLMAALAPTARAEGKCKIAMKGDSPVAAACKKGGVEAATKQMKTLVKAAKAKGVKFSCDGCHDNLDDYALTKGALEDFKKLLEAAK